MSKLFLSGSQTKERSEVEYLLKGWLKLWPDHQSVPWWELKWVSLEGLTETILLRPTTFIACWSEYLLKGWLKQFDVHGCAPGISWSEYLPKGWLKLSFSISSTRTLFVEVTIYPARSAIRGDWNSSRGDLPTLWAPAGMAETVSSKVYKPLLSVEVSIYHRGDWNKVPLLNRWV